MKNEAGHSETACEKTNLHATFNKIDYSTIAEKSIEYSHNTTNFDLYKGFLFMFLSCFFKSIFCVLCKYELDRNLNVSSFHLLTFKAFVMLGITVILGVIYIIMQINKIENGNMENIYIFSKNKLIMMLIRSVLSVFSISLTIYALRYISISEVYSVFYIYPGIVILLSYFILKEKVGAFDYLCLISCFIGVLFVIQPQALFPSKDTSNKSELLIFVLVIIGATLKALEDIIIRNIGKEIHPIIIPSIYSVVSFVLYPLTLILSSDGNLMPEMQMTDYLIIFLIALCSFIYQTLMTLALQTENAGRVAMINYCQVFFMFFSDIFIFNRKIIFLDVLGTFLICFFNLLNGVRKALKRNIELNKFKNSGNIMTVHKDV